MKNSRPPNAPASTAIISLEGSNGVPVSDSIRGIYGMHPAAPEALVVPWSSGPVYTVWVSGSRCPSNGLAPSNFRASQLLSHHLGLSDSPAGPRSSNLAPDRGLQPSYIISPSKRRGRVQWRRKVLPMHTRCWRSWAVCLRSRLLVCRQLTTCRWEFWRRLQGHREVDW